MLSSKQNFVPSKPSRSGHSDVNGISMYYEIYGDGKPLVLIHGGGSTIQTSFERIIPKLAGTRQLIGIELQAHGRTSDRNADSSFEQDADDVATLLRDLGIMKADLFGFSNGATTAMQIAIRHPLIVDRIILGSPLAKRDGIPPFFWEFMSQANLESMPGQLKTAYLNVAPNASGLQIMHDRDAKRMVNFKDIPDEQIRSIQSPVLIMTGDKDIIIPEHALLLSRLIPNARLAIVPGAHGEYMGEITTLKPGSEAERIGAAIVEDFLNNEV